MSLCILSECEPRTWRTYLFGLIKNLRGSELIGFNTRRCFARTKPSSALVKWPYHFPCPFKWFFPYGRLLRNPNGRYNLKLRTFGQCPRQILIPFSVDYTKNSIYISSSLYILISSGP